MTVNVLTAWQLSSPAGISAHCVISGDANGEWHLIVRRGRDIMFSERCPNDEIALGRANAIWSVLVEQGWTEPRH
jgi:hypothetical protein